MSYSDYPAGDYAPYPQSYDPNAYAGWYYGQAQPDANAQQQHAYTQAQQQYAYTQAQQQYAYETAQHAQAPSYSAVTPAAEPPYSSYPVYAADTPSLAASSPSPSPSPAPAPTASPAHTSAAPAVPLLLHQLRNMGYTDDMLNALLLAQYANDISLVVGHYFRLEQHSTSAEATASSASVSSASLPAQASGSLAPATIVATDGRNTSSSSSSSSFTSTNNAATSSAWTPSSVRWTAAAAASCACPTSSTTAATLTGRLPTPASAEVFTQQRMDERASAWSATAMKAGIHHARIACEADEAGDYSLAFSSYIAAGDALIAALEDEHPPLVRKQLMQSLGQYVERADHLKQRMQAQRERLLAAPSPPSASPQSTFAQQHQPLPLPHSRSDADVEQLSQALQALPAAPAHTLGSAGRSSSTGGVYPRPHSSASASPTATLQPTRPAPGLPLTHSPAHSPQLQHQQHPAAVSTGMFPRPKPGTHMPPQPLYHSYLSQSSQAAIAYPMISRSDYGSYVPMRSSASLATSAGRTSTTPTGRAHSSFATTSIPNATARLDPYQNGEHLVQALLVGVNEAMAAKPLASMDVAAADARHERSFAHPGANWNFVEHAPRIFSALRDTCGIPRAQYRKSFQTGTLLGIRSTGKVCYCEFLVCWCVSGCG
jgi:MIT (microtubule interacting and transport) domain